MPEKDLDLSRYDISAERGFLPERDPPRHLPHTFASLENAMEELSDRLAAHNWGPRFQKIAMPNFEPTMYTKRTLEAIFRDLSFATAAWIWEFWQDDKPRLSIPKNIAVPLVLIAEYLGRPPTLEYTQYGPYNYYRFKQDGPIEFRNMGLIRGFYRGLDESGFILPHVEIEARAGRGVVAAMRTQEGAMVGDVDRGKKELMQLFLSLQAVVAALKAIPDCCDTYIYKERVRPFIFGTKGHEFFKKTGGIVYEGVAKYGEKPQAFRGETGAQSSIFPLLDAILGVVHDETDDLSVHLREMRAYMPVKHRELLGKVETRMKVRDFVLNHPELADLFNACIEQMVAFREQHYQFAMAYIFNQPSAHGEHANPHNRGTGGTDFKLSLDEHVKNTKRALILKAA